MVPNVVPHGPVHRFPPGCLVVGRANGRRIWRCLVFNRAQPWNQALVSPSALPLSVLPVCVRVRVRMRMHKEGEKG